MVSIQVAVKPVVNSVRWAGSPGNGIHIPLPKMVHLNLLPESIVLTIHLQKMLTWHKIAETPAELNPGQNGVAVVDVRDKKICLAEYQGQWHGFAYKCPHASGIMANGQLDAMGNIICPLHRYRFSIKNGRNTSGEGYYLKTYPVETRADGIYVGLSSGIFGW